MSYQNKFIVPKRGIDNLEDVKKVIDELTFQITKELTAIAKTAVSSQNIIYQTYTGGSGSSGGGGSATTTEYRAGAVAVVAGTNTITFSSSMSTSSYVLCWSLINSLDELSSATPIVSSFTSGSFQITCLEAGTLYYKVFPKV